VNSSLAIIGRPRKLIIAADVIIAIVKTVIFGFTIFPPA